MTDPRTANARIPTAIDAFTAKVRAVGTNRWDQPTPCTDWTVRDLVNHMTGEHLWAPHLLRGETLEQVGDRYDGDVLGADPVGAWQSAAATSREAWLASRPGVMVHVSSGLITVEDYAEQMYLDLVVHGWDLARGAGLDESIDSDAAEHVRRYAEPHVGHWPGAFAAPVPIESDDPVARMLALLGRDPR